MKRTFLILFFLAVIVILNSCTSTSRVIKYTLNGEQYTYVCTKNDTIKTLCPDGEQLIYILCEDGSPIEITCGDTIHAPHTINVSMYYPSVPGKKDTFSVPIGDTLGLPRLPIGVLDTIP